MYLGVNKNKFSEKRKEFFQGFGFTSGAVLLMVLVFAYPLVNISISAFKRAGNFIGLENYSALLADPVFITSLKNNFKLLIIVPFIIFIALVLAVVINERPKGWKIHRFTILIPFILPIPVSAITLAAIVAYRGGLNSFLISIGLDSFALDWLGQGSSAFLVIAFALIWREIGFCSILIFSRLSSIDNEIVEASQLDGAGWWRRLRHAVLPQISGVLATVVVLEIITVFFYTFEWVYILTRGGPAGTTMVVDLYIFQQAVTFRSIGIAAAASSSILIILITSLLVVRLVRHQLRMISFNARNRVIKPKITQRTSISIKRAPKTEKRFTLKIKKFLTSLGRQFLLWLLTLIFVLPLYFILVNAFKTKADYGSSPWALPINPTLDSFREAFSRGEIAIWFRNSVIVSFGTVLLVTITAVLATYYVSVGPKKFSKYFRRLFVPLIAIPPIIMIIPLFVLFSNLGLINTFPGAILVFAGLLLPFSCYLLLSFFDTFPREILEAAAVDGSSKLGTLIRIILPNAKPVLGTQFVINLLYVWNSLLIVLIFLQGDDRRTLAAGISVFQGRFFRDTPLVMAASLLVILPMFLVYIFTQRSLRKGLMAGAVK
jgi:ABC-type glycerol-3-phosphate transport system permease component